LDGQEGTVYQDDPVSGEEHVVSFARLRLPPGSEPLGVILEEPWEAVLDPMMRFSLAAPLVLLPVALLTALAITLGLRRIVRPLQQLQAAAQRVEEGDLDALARGPHRDGIQEIKDLGATLEKMAARIQTDQRSLRAHAQAVMRAQESERARLAHELHDDTIQNLVALAQRAQLLKAMLPAEAPAQARLGELRDHAQRMIDDVRRISRGLRPIYLEEAGLMSALERLALETDELSAQRSPPVRVTFECAGDITRQAPEVELALFRIAQEAIGNALRHAEARRVKVELSGSPEALALTVADDGRGFDVSQPGNPDGLGIFSIRERASAIGATVDVSSAPGAGARVKVALALGPSSG
jgi:two-component system sensor histidine kinase UhpB